MGEVVMTHETAIINCLINLKNDIGKSRHCDLWHYEQAIDEAIEIITCVTCKWISDEDRLPEAGEHYQSDDVLVCIDYRPNDPEITEDTYVSIDHVDFNCFGQGCFSCERDDPRNGEPSPYFVTHWMPLPKPPKGE